METLLDFLYRGADMGATVPLILFFIILSIIVGLVWYGLWRLDNEHRPYWHQKRKSK